MSELLIERFCKMLSGQLREYVEDIEERRLIELLRSIVQESTELRTVFESKMVQLNQDDSVGFQTWVESGAKAFIGSNYIIQDSEVLKAGLRFLLDDLAKQPVGTPENLPYTGASKFVGRDYELETLHQMLQQSNTVAISAVAGMGGVGKTELALQYAYAQLKQNSYPGGICWLGARQEDIGIEIVRFALTHLGMPEPPEDFDLLKKVEWICQRWKGEPILLVMDDVTDYKVVKPYLQKLNSRFKVLMTSRMRFGSPVKRLDLDVLSLDASLEMLRDLMGNADRIDHQLADAQLLCEWLGYLPLGLELVGRYLADDEDISLAEMLQLLKQKRLAAEALLEAYPEMTTHLGVATAFELSWQEVDADAKKLGCLLSLFGLAPIPWQFVEQCLPDWEERRLAECRDRQLKKRNLIKRVEQKSYQLHQLLREFLAVKRSQMSEEEEMKRSFCAVMIVIAEQIPHTVTLSVIERVTAAIPHIKEAATTLSPYVMDKDLNTPSTRIARFYIGQFAFGEAEKWYRQCQASASQRLGEEHWTVATSLNNLADLYTQQGRYREAEPLFIQALEITQRQLGNDHSSIATASHNLAKLYFEQGRYEEAEPLYLRALKIDQQLLGDNHPFVATSLNSLANLYIRQKKYEEAEPLFVRALKIRQQLLGEDKYKSDIVSSLNDLANLYSLQERYTEAEVLFIQALKITLRTLGNEHPYMATSLGNLADLYLGQKRYGEAEALYVRALQLNTQILGDDHPYVAIGYKRLGLLYIILERYAEAETLLLQAINILYQRLEADHPDIQETQQIFLFLVQQVIQSNRVAELSDHLTTQGFLRLYLKITENQYDQR